MWNNDMQPSVYHCMRITKKENLNMGNKKVAVLLANGFEEGEALFVVDIIRRAGFICDAVSVEEEIVQGSHGIKTIADLLLKKADLDSYDMIVLPGGLPGADTLRDNETVISWVKDFAARPDKYVAAICAAPQVLAKAGVTTGRRLTSYPGEKYQKLFTDAQYVDDNSLTEECVVVDGNLITSRGPGTTLPFAYRLVEILGGDADKLRQAMQYNALKQSWKS
jgi:4-methyl-5(b-hydroxyethyl)-thiazole monophosphate biosynthesis